MNEKKQVLVYSADSGKRAKAFVAEHRSKTKECSFGVRSGLEFRNGDVEKVDAVVLLDNLPRVSAAYHSAEWPDGHKVSVEVLAVSETVDDSIDLTPLKGSSTLPNEIDINGKPVPLGEIVDAAFQASGLSVTKWNELSEEEADELLNLQINSMKSQGSESAQRPKISELGAPELKVLAKLNGVEYTNKPEAVKSLEAIEADSDKELNWPNDGE